ncbi:GLPGLI family protein [Polaribacter sp. Asnod1-A03]|uniref:GLPGLI family protein n=1 Tax=Polaribacter sp. Asnod1-A03 TaxID=3160581 RepID=UPI0038638716
MKIKKVFLLFFIIPFISFSQKKISGKVIYKYRVKQQVFKSEKESDNIKPVLNNFNKNLENNKDQISFELIFNNNSSYYKLIKKLNPDTDKGIDFAKLYTGGKEEIYTNKNKNLKIKKIDVFGDFFLVNSKFKENWKLTQETKKIGKYICFKAFLVKEIKGFNNKKSNFITQVWYSPEIPANFGPKGYGNLPGLILELEQGGIIYYAQKIELNNKKNIVINPPKKGNIISEEDFSDMFRKIDKKRH